MGFVTEYIVDLFFTDRQTDGQTNSLTPYTGCVDFFFKLNLLAPYSLHVQGDNVTKLPKTSFNNLETGLTLF